MGTYADAPECAEVIKSSVVEMLLQELEKRIENLKIKAESLQKQFKPILMDMDKSNSPERKDSPSEKYPAHSPLAKRLEALIKLHKEIAHTLDALSQDAEI